jgi:hypothetical protein
MPKMQPLGANQDDWGRQNRMEPWIHLGHSPSKLLDSFAHSSMGCLKVAQELGCFVQDFVLKM